MTTTLGPGGAQGVRGYLIGRNVFQVDVKLTRPAGLVRKNAGGVIEVLGDRIVAIGDRLWKGLPPLLVERIVLAERVLLKLLASKNRIRFYNIIVPEYSRLGNWYHDREGEKAFMTIPEQKGMSARLTSAGVSALKDFTEYLGEKTVTELAKVRFYTPNSSYATPIMSRLIPGENDQETEAKMEEAQQVLGRTIMRKFAEGVTNSLDARRPKVRFTITAQVINFPTPDGNNRPGGLLPDA